LKSTMRLDLQIPTHRPVAHAAGPSFSFQPPAEALRGAAAALLLFGSSMVTTPQALALDAKAVGTCVVSQCTKPLARCIIDPTCAANLACIQTCTGKPDEGDCQIKCGDEFSDDVVGEFTKCAVTEKNCVPQRQDDGSWPVPKDSVLVPKFTTEALEGTWYISAGLNKAFDTFDCQRHVFTAPSPTKLVGNLQWRIKDPIAGSNFVTRYTVQEFEQDKLQPGILYNHDNEFLHYTDDWYILAEKPNEYVLVYYRGSNDAWDGYGGAVVYSTKPALDPKYFPELDAALRKIGRKFSDFELTDNTCKAPENKLEEFEKDLVFIEARVAQGIQVELKAVEQEIVKDVVAVEKEVVKDVVAVEKEVVKDVVAVEQEVVKDFIVVEKTIEKDLKIIENSFEKAAGMPVKK